MCVRSAKSDDVVFIGALFTQLCTWCYLYWLQHQELTHLWSHQYTCTGFSIKNSLTCDHLNTRALASTSRTHSSVMSTTTNRSSPFLWQTASSCRFAIISDFWIKVASFIYMYMIVLHIYTILYFICGYCNFLHSTADFIWVFQVYFCFVRI